MRPPYIDETSKVNHRECEPGPHLSSHNLRHERPLGIFRNTSIKSRQATSRTVQELTAKEPVYVRVSQVVFTYHVFILALLSAVY
jgi:hypothetical protein